MMRDEKPSKPVASTQRDLVSLTNEERAVLDAIRGTSFGAVEVVVHQSRIVQIVKTEKVRVDGATPLS